MKKAEFLEYTIYASSSRVLHVVCLQLFNITGLKVEKALSFEFTLANSSTAIVHDSSSREIYSVDLKATKSTAFSKIVLFNKSLRVVSESNYILCEIDKNSAVNNCYVDFFSSIKLASVVGNSTVRSSFIRASHVFFSEMRESNCVGTYLSHSEVDSSCLEESNISHSEVLAASTVTRSTLSHAKLPADVHLTSIYLPTSIKLNAKDKYDCCLNGALAYRNSHRCVFVRKSTLEIVTKRVSCKYRLQENEAYTSQDLSTCSIIEK
jgi:hypothetical protein